MTALQAACAEQREKAFLFYHVGGRTVHSGENGPFFYAHNMPGRGVLALASKPCSKCMARGRTGTNISKTQNRKADRG